MVKYNKRNYSAILFLLVVIAGIFVIENTVFVTAQDETNYSTLPQCTNEQITQESSYIINGSVITHYISGEESEKNYEEGNLMFSVEGRDYSMEILVDKIIKSGSFWNGSSFEEIEVGDIIPTNYEYISSIYISESSEYYEKYLFQDEKILNKDTIFDVGDKIINRKIGWYIYNFFGGGYKKECYISFNKRFELISLQTSTVPTPQGIGSPIIKSLSPKSVYAGIPSIFKVAMDKEELNGPGNWSVELNIKKDGTSICGTANCIVVENKADIKKAGYNISIEEVDETGARPKFKISINNTETDSIGVGENDEIDVNDKDLNVTIISAEMKWDNETTIKEYFWNFSIPKASGKTLTNELNYTFNASGSYELNITITDKNSRKYSKVFIIEVKSPSDIVQNLLASKISDLTIINSFITSNFSVTEAGLVKRSLELADAEAVLTSLQGKEVLAATDQDYIEIYNNLTQISIPESVAVTESIDNTPLFSDSSNINLNSVVSFAGGSYSSSQESGYINGIIDWNIKNLDMELDYKEASVLIEGEILPETLKIFSLKASKRTGFSGESPYLILKDLGDIEFAGSYGQQTKEGFIGIPIDASSETFVFSTMSDVSFDTLPVFASPSLADISPLEGTVGAPKKIEKQSKWILFSLIVGLLILIGVVVYVVMMLWYKKKYESYLFKNKNDLYNIVNYVKNSKSKGKSNSEILESLKKAGWTSEQIKYVMKKVK